MICDDCPLEEQHSRCPKENTWCKYWEDVANGTNIYCPKTNRLPSVFKEELQPIFKRLTNDEPFNQCLMGLTQNQNESINNVLWSICPKTKFCGDKKVLLAAAEAICRFNTGAASRALLLESVRIKPGCKMLNALREEDDTRIYHATQKTNVDTHLKRRKRRADKKSAGCTKPTTYLAGGFGLSKHPEVDVNNDMDIYI